METVRFGVIGLGVMGTHHVGYLDSLPGAKLGAVCDIDPKRLDTIKAKTSAPQFDHSDKLIDSGLCDAVLICTPHYDHPPIAERAFARGLHVLSEKPIAVSVGPARKLNASYEKYSDKLKFGVMFQQRTKPIYRKMRELIGEGEIGEITRITWVVTDWFRTWTYYASGGWRATWAGEGGGVLLNQCPHNLDLLQWIVGGMTPKRVTAVATIAKTHPIEVEDEVSAILEYPNGAVGHFVTSTGEAAGSSRLEVVGDRGALIAEKGATLHFRKLRRSGADMLQNSKEMFPIPETWEFEMPIRQRPEGHRVITENFVASVLRDEPLLSPGIDGVKGLEIGNAMLMAGITRRPVDLPMDGEAYDAFLLDLARRYGGKKELASRDAAANVDMSSSFR